MKVVEVNHLKLVPRNHKASLQHWVEPLILSNGRPVMMSYWVIAAHINSWQRNLKSKESLHANKTTNKQIPALNILRK